MASANSCSVGKYSRYFEAKSWSFPFSTEYFTTVSFFSVHKMIPIVGLSSDGYVCADLWRSVQTTWWSRLWGYHQVVCTDLHNSAHTYPSDDNLFFHGDLLLRCGDDRAFPDAVTAAFRQASINWIYKCTSLFRRPLTTVQYLQDGTAFSVMHSPPLCGWRIAAIPDGTSCRGKPCIPVLSWGSALL